MHYLIITYKNHRHTTKIQTLTSIIMSYLPLNSERITTTHICQGFMYRRWPNRRPCQIESRSRKLATLELPGSFHIYGGYYLFVYLVTTRNLRVQCWKVNQPYCVVKNVTKKYSSLIFKFLIVPGNCIRSFTVHKVNWNYKRTTFKCRSNSASRTAGLLVGGSKHLQRSLNWLHLQNHRQILAAMLCT